MRKKVLPQAKKIRKKVNGGFVPYGTGGGGMVARGKKQKCTKLSI